MNGEPVAQHPGPNRTRLDPQLRRLSVPLHIRLRERIDTLADANRHLDDETHRLSRELRKRENELAALRRQVRDDEAIIAGLSEDLAAKEAALAMTITHEKGVGEPA